MKNAMNKAILDGIAARKDLLQSLTQEQRTALLDMLLIDFFDTQHELLQKWAAITGQTGQVDTGYISQFAASLALGIPGQGFRGKGDDLADGSEVKSAANISGVDRPRWNHNLGSLASDHKAREKGNQTTWEKYLAVPYLFYVLADRSATSTEHSPIRVRAWCIDVQEDTAWRSLVTKWVDNREGDRSNFQLHPPVGYDDNIVVNTLGNLDFSDVKVFEALIVENETGSKSIEWTMTPKEIPPILGRTKATPYGGRKDRPTNFTAVEDIVADVATVADLFPSIFTQEQASDLEGAIAADTEVASESIGSDVTDIEPLT